MSINISIVSEQIAQKLIAPAKQLHKEGIPIHAYLSDLTWLLFLKIAPALGQKSYLSSDYSWERLVQTNGIKQYHYYQEIIKQMGQVNHSQIAGIYAYADTFLKTPAQLAQIITALTAIEKVPIKDLGAIYETLLDKSTHLDGKRLHLVPRSLVNLMVILSQPQLGELIQDPLAGTASFIVAAHEYMQMMKDELLESSPSLSNKPPHFRAVEPDLVRQRLALMNCFLHQIENSDNVPVQWGDRLLSEFDGWPQADVIFSVLVFASAPWEELGKHDVSLALLQQIYQTLKPGGRAAVVLPDHLLRAVGPAQQVRRTLLDTCVVHTILRLPYGIFYPHKVAAHLLFFWRSPTSSQKTKTVWFYDLRTHFPIFGRYLHLKREHLLPFEKVYGDDPLGQAPRHLNPNDKHWFCFDRDRLAKQNDRLDLCCLTEDKWMEIDKIKEPNMIKPNVTEKIWNVLEKTMDDLEDLTQILG